jgi:hypothetical protein
MDIRKRNNGIQLLINRFTNKFEVEENINYYSFKDFVRARRKYLKYMLEGPRVTTTNCGDRTFMN